MPLGEDSVLEPSGPSLPAVGEPTGGATAGPSPATVTRDQPAHAPPTPADALPSGRRSSAKRPVSRDSPDGTRFPFALPRGETPVTTLLSVLQGAHSAGEGIFGFLSTREANTLRLVCGEFRDAVSEARWHDKTARVSGPLAAWRKCLPGARAANVAGRADLRDADFARFAGLKALDMWDCTGITDAGLTHLVGIHTLNMCGCRGITDAGLAHLTGIHTLDMSWCTGITDAGLAHLAGIHALTMYNCNPATIKVARARFPLAFRLL